MVKFTSAVVLASIFAAFVSAAPINAGSLKRRSYEEVNHYAAQPQIVTSYRTIYKTVTKTVHDGNPAPTPTSNKPKEQGGVPPANPTPAGKPAYGDWRADMLNQVNAVRAKAGKGPLVLDEQLNKIAQDHSDYQNSIKTMTHDDAKGGLGARFNNVGVKWSGIAENIAWNQKDVTDVVNSWYHSEGHYKNMIGDYKKVGFGVNMLYWTQVFCN
ncbi:SCP-domain-containing protein [Martensiomyces pterosporus]|nr:SCP-domain-containing protein [Martensiomyces pterosporus]